MGNAVTVNGERYRNMINTFLEPQLEARHLRNISFQQDGATNHTAGETIILSPKSPNLTIQEKIWQINDNTLAKATENFEKILKMCCRKNGHHLTEFVFHT